MQKVAQSGHGHGADNPTYLKFPGDKAVVMVGVAGCSLAVLSLVRGYYNMA